MVVAVADDYRADPILGEALRYWQRKRGHRPMPSRRDIDPTEIPRLLAHLQLIEVIDRGARFKYRLVGTAIVDSFGQDYTGRFVDEQFPGARGDFIQKVYRAVCETRRPVFLRNDYKTARDLPIVAMRLFLPLSQDSQQVDIVMGACRFDFARGAAAGTWGSATLDGTRYHMEIVDPACPAAA